MDGGGAYGAGKATGTFDVIAFVKKPQVILRVVSWVSRPGRLILRVPLAINPASFGVADVDVAAVVLSAGAA